TLKKMTESIQRSNENYSVVIIGADGSELNSESLIGTGCILKVTDASGTSTYTIIIRGDINGDGKVNLQDLLLVKKNILGMTALEGNRLKAALISGDTEVSLKTYLSIKKYILGMQDIPQD
ncbi:MAG: dockerin type I repeat-containing protein, partial [Erysipelotrichaceae bacterium]|nr:dockerin type I repeat-containing protein [Erysipelotrichaceae bacterium]